MAVATSRDGTARLLGCPLLCQLAGGQAEMLQSALIRRS